MFGRLVQCSIRSMFAEKVSGFEVLPPVYAIVCTLFAIRMLNKHLRPQMASLFRSTLWLSRMWQVAHCELALKSLLFLFLCFACVYNFYFLSAPNTPCAAFRFSFSMHTFPPYIWSTQKDLWHLWANKKTRELHEIIKHTINLSCHAPANDGARTFRVIV